MLSSLKVTGFILGDTKNKACESRRQETSRVVMAEFSLKVSENNARSVAV